MLQHMQYTVDKCVYFLYSALLNHKRQEQQQQQQQQSAATMPSKPAVTGKCQCFKNPTPLMSAAVECVCSRVYAALCVCVSEEACGSHAEHTASSYYAHPRSRDGKQEGAHTAHHSTHNPADSLVPFRQTPPTWTPDHLSNNSLYSLSSQWTESGNWAPAPQTVFSWKNDATKAYGSFRKDTQRLVSITDVAL